MTAPTQTRPLAPEFDLPTGQAFWDDLVEQGIAGRPATREQALAVLATPDDDLMSLVAAAGRVRRHHFGRRIVLNYLVNVKSGICPEDCHYCSQSRTSKADILKYTWLTKERVMQQVDAGVARGASTVCLVASGRGPSDKDMTRMGEIVEEIKATNPEVKVCACLGLIDEAKASALAAAGVDRYNHNLNTAEDMYADICSTHTYEDRRETLRAITSQGISACSGLIAGMGETDDQLVDVVMALAEMDADSIPVNFLLPFEGTPLEAHNQLTPQRCLKILAMVRFICPDREVRIAAGREYHIRSLQPLALEICNSIFLGDYLTSEGQATQRDLDMISDLGFEIVGSVATTDPEADESHVVDAAGVPLRRRGAGVKTPQH